ncbi:hypothetical protein [Achromobacter spanius]|uniref:hypothetical protein n=1 Tax=Achromobacter spanius TaxID=217203 RepID=UPI003A90E8AD
MAILFKSHEEIIGRENFQPQILVSNGDLDRIIGGYDFDPAMQLRCGLNNCNQLHQRGYVIATKQGVETVCGNVCGARELGVDFTEMAARFTTQVDEQKRQQSIHELQQNAHAYLEQCSAIKAKLDAVYPALSEIRSSLRRDAEINRAVDLVIREGGRIRVHEELSAAQRANAAATKQRANLQTIGTIQGVNALRDYPKAANVIENELLATIKEIQKLDPATTRGRVLNAIAAKINAFPAALVFLKGFLDDTQELLTSQNFEHFEKIARMGAVKAHKLTPILEKIAYHFYEREFAERNSKRPAT